MRILATASALVLSIAVQASAEQPTGDSAKVQVLGRDWQVWSSSRVPGEHVARRLNAELLPFRAPSVLGARQAVRAFHSATGCFAQNNSIYRTENGDYHAVLICSR